MLIDLRYLSENHFNSILGYSPLKNQSTDLRQSPRSQKQEDQPVQQRATRKRWRWNSGVLGGPASNQNKLVNRSSQPDQPPQPKPRGDPLPRARNRWLTASTVQARRRERTYVCAFSRLWLRNCFSFSVFNDWVVQLCSDLVLAARALGHEFES